MRTFPTSVIRTTIFSLVFLLAFQHAFAQNEEKGCFLSANSKSLGALRTSSGDPAIDQIANEEIARLRGMLGLNPAFYFYDDSGAPNAKATSRIEDPNYQDGTVYFGLTLHKMEMERSPGGTPIPMIMAHEFGHILAFKNKLDFEGKRNELFADYCAGSYMLFRQEWKGTPVWDTLKTFWDMGDYDFNSPDPHGTPQERYDAVLRGYLDSQAFKARGQWQSLESLIDLGSRYVNSIK